MAVPELFGAPAPPYPGDVLYGTIKAEADAGELQARATSQAVDSVLAALQGAFQQKARREERAMDALLERDMEMRRQAGRMQLAEFEQEAYGKRHAADLAQKRAEEFNRAREAKLKRGFEYQKAARDLALNRRTERRLSQTAAEASELHGLKMLSSKLDADIQLQELNKNRQDQEAYDKVESTKALFKEYAATLNAHRDADGLIRFDTPEEAGLLMGFAGRAQDPALFLEMAEQGQKVQSERLKTEQVAAKGQREAQAPQREAEEAEISLRQQAIKEGKWTEDKDGKTVVHLPSEEWINDYIKRVRPPKKGGKGAAPGAATSGADPLPLDISDEELDALSEEEFQERLKAIKAAKPAGQAQPFSYDTTMPWGP